MKKKTHQFEQGKVLEKAWKSAHIGFLAMPIAMHYVRALCDKYFLTYDGFSLIFNRKV